MGYYSIYRIIKDIIKTIFGRKFLKFTLIVLICFTIFFIMGENGVFASFSVTTDNGTTYILPDNNYEHIVILKYNGYWSGNYCGVLFYNGDIYFNSVSGNITYSVVSSDNSTFGYILDKSNTTTDFSPFSLSSSPSIQKDFKNLDIIYSNGVVYKNNEIIINPVKNAQFYNKDNFINFSSDSLIVYPNDYDISDNLYLNFLTVDSTVTDDNNTIYYYAQRTFVLNSNSKYFNTYEGVYYYNIPRYIFSLEANKQYIFFLTDNDDRINNTVGLYDYSNDFDGFTLSPTSQQITPTDTIIDNQQNQNNSINNIDDFINNDNVDDSTNDDIDDTLQFDTSNNATNFVTGFFSNISDLFVSLSDYDLDTVTTINLPIPFTNSIISLRSDLLSSHIDSNLIQIITLFWYFLFGMYYIKFMISISKSITTGDAIVGTVKVPEVITDDVL